ncbi:YaaR family protein [Phosphitispora sp. TUW77]|uniref:YaaR family protein n=1 Tax=Phosphitispora sp. TUW77 TaxID=3152361 RepID=UPI003AB6BE7F
MKIRKITKEAGSGISIPDKDARQVSSREYQSFNEQLHKVHSDMVYQQLGNLLSDIEKQGKVLGETLNLTDLKKYKGMIQKFLEYAVNKMYQMREQHGWDRRGRHKIYSMVETVNKEMEGLTQMLLSEQKDKIAILAKVDEIRGLLLDIYS